MKWCSNCVLPDTRPNLIIEEDGICNACHNHESKEIIDWQRRNESLRKIVESAKRRAKDYDCLIPVSGGKDSTWQVVKCLELGLKPLTLTWRPPVEQRSVKKNLDNLRRRG